jgi:hypothetical protein
MNAVNKIKQTFNKMYAPLNDFLTKIEKDHPEARRQTEVSKLYFGSALCFVGLALLPGTGPIGAFASTLAIGFSAFSVLCGAAMAWLAHDSYKREEAENKAIETTTNTLDQEVTGPHWAIHRLQQAQEKIFSLSAAFNTSATLDEKTQEAVIALINDPDITTARAAVTVKNNTNETYSFARIKTSSDVKTTAEGRFETTTKAYVKIA